MTAWDVLWLAVIGVVTVADLVAARFEKGHGAGATLSAHIRDWGSLERHDRRWVARRLAVGALWLILGSHLFLSFP